MDSINQKRTIRSVKIPIRHCWHLHKHLDIQVIQVLVCGWIRNMSWFIYSCPTGFILRAKIQDLEPYKLEERSRMRCTGRLEWRSEAGWDDAGFLILDGGRVSFLKVMSKDARCVIRDTGCRPLV